MPSAKIAAEAKREGISERTLSRAKKRLGVSSLKDGPTWYWYLPDKTDLTAISNGGRADDFGEYKG